MKYILLLLSLSLLNLEAFDTLIDVEKLGGKKSTYKRVLFGKPLRKKVVSQENDILKKSIQKSNLLKPFITPMELKNILDNKDAIIFDTDDLSIYNKGHINGAIHVDVKSFTYGERNPYKLMKSDSIIKDKIINLGVNKKSKVIIYAHNTQSGNLNSSYLAFILITFGFENVSILDGGYMAWVIEYDLLVNKTNVEIDDEGDINLIPKNISVDAKYLKENIGRNFILDARATPYYYGTKIAKNIKTQGHIPQAKSSFYKNKFLKDGTIRSDDELNDIYIHGFRLSKDDNIIVYGESVYDAVVEWYIVYQKMGFKNAKLYEKSFLEYDALNYEGVRFRWE